jgi:hypothetical protein
MMKAITMTQPWATLLAVGANRIETRSWPTNFRGPLAIHAALGFPPHAAALCRQSPYAEALAAAGYHSAADLPRGKIISVGVLEELLRCDQASAASVTRQSRAGQLPPGELAFGDFSAGRFGFVMAAMRALPSPVPARGMLGLWTVPPAIEQQVLAQLAEPRPAAK